MKTLAEGGSDHFPVLFNVWGKPERTERQRIYNFTRTDWDQFRLTLNDCIPTASPQLTTPVQIDAAVDSLTDEITQAIRSSTPLYQPTPRRIQLPPEILEIIRRKNLARRRWQVNRNNEDKREMNVLQRIVRESISRWRAERWKEMLRNTFTQDNSLWKLIRRFNKQWGRPNPTLRTGNVTASTDAEKAAMMASHFAAVNNESTSRGNESFKQRVDAQVKRTLTGKTSLTFNPNPKDSRASSDINDNDDDPTPRDNDDNKHGTRCAGEVAASAYNSYCGVGVAYNASIGGVRMLDGSVNDAVEARALSLNPEHIDVYSASWGPEDDGKTVDGPGPLATRAFVNGITTGRGGKGSIFIWASGNGGRHTDSCNCDGYTNSIYTLSISSATQAGLKPWYLEECSSTIATTYSSGTLGRDKSVASVDMDPKLRPERMCTTQHTGTSASAPLAAGMVALALEANPELTWRDVQHIVVMSAKSAPLEKEAGWTTNGANRKVSHKFGFGLMDGGAMVSLAELWTKVPRQLVHKTEEIVEHKSLGSRQGSTLTVKTNVTGWLGVRYLEQVQCKLSVSLQPRGHLRLELVSPQGTRSTLLRQRPRDTLAATYQDWPFLSVHYWGEDPLGVWTLVVTNAGSSSTVLPGELHKWQLVLYGTEVNPVKIRTPLVNSWYNYKKRKGDHLTANDVMDVDARPGGRWKAKNRKHKCHSQCDVTGCYGPKPTQCVKCANFKLHRTCVGECPMYGYFAGSDGLCSRCGGNCLRCSGPGLDGCLSCLPGLYLVTDLGLCLHHCPNFYYEDSDNWKCIGCDENCASCHKSPKKCSSCEPSYVLHNGSCLHSCPRNTCINHHRRCVPCRKSCPNCKIKKSCSKDLGSQNNASLTQCEMQAICQTRRHPTHYHKHSKHHIAHLNICQQGYYSVKGECKRCWSSCSSCYGGRKDECLGCNTGLRPSKSGECRPLCPRHMYHRQFYSQDNRTVAYKCDYCHPSCATCNSGGPYGCTWCALGRYLEKSTGLCPACDKTCATCLGPEPFQCTSCHSHTHLRDGRCSPTTRRTSCLHCPENDEVHSYENAGKRGIPVESMAEVEMLKSLRHSKSPQYSPVVAVAVIAVIACLAIAILFTLLISALQIR